MNGLKLLFLGKIMRFEMKERADNQIREDLGLLWEKIFGDSKEYISLLFDNYLSKSFTGVCKDGDRITGGLLAIPYKYRCNYDVKNRCEGSALYLCGLMTDESYRRKGIMGKLIESVANQAANMGYSFLFLIPSSEDNRRYYKSKGFADYFYYNVCEYNSERGVNSINFADCYCEELSVEDYSMCTDICRYLTEKEESIRGLVIRHSMKDFRVIIDENNLSNGSIYYVKDNDGCIKGVAIGEPENGAFFVKLIISDNVGFSSILAKKIITSRAGERVLFYLYPGQDSQKEKEVFTKIRRSEYGMLRKCCKYENEKMVKGSEENFNFQIFAPGSSDSNFTATSISCYKKDPTEEGESGTLFLMLD